MQIKFSDYNAIKVESNSNNNNNKSIMGASFRVTNDPWLLEFNFCILPFCIVLVDLFTNGLWCKSCQVFLRLDDKGHQSFLLAMSWIACLRGTWRSSAKKSTREGGVQASDKSSGLWMMESPYKSHVSNPPWARSPNLLQPLETWRLDNVSTETPKGLESEPPTTSLRNFWHQKQKNIINIDCFKLPSCGVIC